MTARTTRRTFTLGAVATTAGALALALIPATVASAGTPVAPVFSYIDVSGGTPANPVRQLAAADAVGVGPHNLTPPNYQTYTYDVSPDGATSVIAARTGSPTTNAYDSTFGLVVVHTDGSAPTSKVLAQFWDGNPVLFSTDTVTKVWWMAGSTLYRADAATGTVDFTSTAFAPATSETVSRLAVSADGTVAAVLYRGKTTATADRVFAAPVAGVGSPATQAQVSYAAANLKPDSSTFVWLRDDTLLYAESDPTIVAPAHAPLFMQSLQLKAGSSTTTPGPLAGLNEFYDVRPDAAGTTWWMWKDDTTVTPNTATAWSVSLLLADLPTTDPATWTPVTTGTPRSNGDSTVRYTPSTVTPQALDAAVATNRAVVHTTFGLSPTSVKYGARSAYQSIGLYGGVPLTAFNANNAAETDRGTLWSSINVGGPWSAVATTSGASVFPIGTQWYNGHTPVLARNTWFKWTSAGDAFTAPFTSVVRKVSVVPTVKVAVKKYAHGARRIAGSATRSYGVAQLWRYYKGAWRKVTTIAISRAGGYNFGTRGWPRGTYRVITVADAGWASGSLQFAF
jgi:hypothetical protein